MVSTFRLIKCFVCLYRNIKLKKSTQTFCNNKQKESTHLKKMSDFVPRDILPELWDEIIKRHWTYFDTEESILKLEKRKKLEGKL